LIEEIAAACAVAYLGFIEMLAIEAGIEHSRAAIGE